VRWGEVGAVAAHAHLSHALRRGPFLSPEGRRGTSLPARMCACPSASRGGDDDPFVETDFIFSQTLG